MISCFGRLAALDPSPDPQRTSGPYSSHPGASAVTPPRQLATTVGHGAALAGVFIRTGNLIGTGERVVSGLVQRLGALRFVSDNAGCFGTGRFRAAASSSLSAASRSTLVSSPCAGIMILCRWQKILHRFLRPASDPLHPLPTTRR